MAIIERIPQHPFERFRAIYAQLQSENRWWMDYTSWLRFAAQAAVAAPGDPTQVADAIRSMAASFRRDTGWLDALHSPLRFVVAAMLVQAGRDGDAFAAELERARRLIHAAGVRHGGMFEVMAILLLWLQDDRQPIPPERIARLVELYAHLKQMHWWLTGPHDLPTCASLVALPGEPAAIAAEVESYYQRLHRWGMAPGVVLEQVAHILPLAGEPIDAAVERYTALVAGFRRHDRVPIHSDYEAIAVLGLLDLDPEAVTAAAVDMYQRVDALVPRLHDEVRIDLAADLAFLELIHRDRRVLGMRAGGAAADVDAIIRAGQAAAAIVACFGAISLDPNSC